MPTTMTLTMMPTMLTMTIMNRRVNGYSTAYSCAKNPHISSLLSQESGSQDIGINLMQFHSFIDKRVTHSSTRAQRARNLNFN